MSFPGVRLALVAVAVGLTVAGCLPEPVQPSAPAGIVEEVPAAPPAAPAQECVVKGNVSIDSGELIYHVPGQEFYDETIIREEFGERWFCSEEEAVAAGWRKSLR
ncbi:sunset domain-containing protein [Cellulomonas terrae]|uniref:Nuclease n=1 Tax=Cellulomonas terrae TaxID=311234 RepID=A0A511JKA1_9CELL|nr:hypothetical protein [Cellulomonas terrae]GEL98335.1 hypothetical protein CTE05_18820 [Cellulomonas terrae]